MDDTARPASEIVVAHIEPPTSKDARGGTVATRLTVVGDTITMHVAATDGSAYPIRADPVIVGQNDTQPCSSLVRSGTFKGRGVLVRDCRVWFAIGFNDYRLMNYAAGLPHPFVNSTTVNQGCGPILDSEDQAYELQRIAETGSNVVRVWFFQKYFQDFRDDASSSGHDPWTPYVHLLQAAKARGLLVIPVLTNDWNQCDREPSTGTSSPANNQQHADYSFYEEGPGGADPGYLTPGTFGYTYSAKQWAAKVADEFGPNGPHADLTSTIAFYQVINEAEVDISPTDAQHCGPTGAQALRDFGQDMASTIKAQYSGHTEPLVSLGTMGIGQCGVSSNVPDPVGTPNRSDFAYAHSAPAIDLCEVHDYDAEAVSDPTFDWYSLPANNLAQRIKECGAKPIFVGEAGIEANVQPGDITRTNHDPSPPPVDKNSLHRRAMYLSHKLATDLNAGVSGYVLWDKIMAGSDSAWNKVNDETLGYGAYGLRADGVRHQDPALCVVQEVAGSWHLGDAPPDVASQAACDARIPPAGPANHYGFVDGTTEGWSTDNTWGDLTVSTATGNAPPGHPSSDTAKHALKLTIGSDQSPAIEVESDSVALLQVSKDVVAVDGVHAAQVAMATELNLEVLAGMGFTIPEASPNDMVVALRVESTDHVELALAAVDTALEATRRRSSDSGRDEEPARTTGSALTRSRAGMALISVPGQSATVEAMDALEAGRDVMIFSDNVPLHEEIALKMAAAASDVLVMGPDCGTAVVTGIGLGFSNTVRPGPVGIIAASGTGCQQLLTLLDHAGVGITAALGVGGRDLGPEVRGLSTRQALRRLDADPATELIVVVSKPPADDVAREVREFAATLSTPVQFALLGQGQPDLTQAAEAVLDALGRDVPEWPVWGEQASAGSGQLRGLFAGGTLCDEAMILAEPQLGRVWSNIPLDGSSHLDSSLEADGTVMIDFGSDEMTQGRPHPMIDPTIRLDHLSKVSANPEVRVVLMDVVLGHGADADPAGTLAPAIRAAHSIAEQDGRELSVVIACVGTSGDPQGLTAQAQALADAGAEVHLSNARAARRAVSLIGSAS